MSQTLRHNDDGRSVKYNHGSLYMVVAQLVKARFIVATEPTREGRRPERTVYELTGEGRAELRDWLRELVEEPRHEYPHFVAALSLIGALPPRVPAGARNGPSFMARRAPRHPLRRRQQP